MVCLRTVAGWVESVVSACGGWGSPCVGNVRCVDAGLVDLGVAG